MTIGNTVNFTCQYNSSEGDTDLTIVWKIEGEKVCNRSGQACTMNNTRSVLHLANTSSFTMGNYEVQCILKRIISPPFLSDPSFSEELKNDIIQEATQKLVCVILFNQTTYLVHHRQGYSTFVFILCGSGSHCYHSYRSSSCDDENYHTHCHPVPKRKEEQRKSYFYESVKQSVCEQFSITVEPLNMDTNGAKERVRCPYFRG